MTLRKTTPYARHSLPNRALRHPAPRATPYARHSRSRAHMTGHPLHAPPPDRARACGHAGRPARTAASEHPARTIAGERLPRYVIPSGGRQAGTEESPPLRPSLALRCACPGRPGAAAGEIPRLAPLARNDITREPLPRHDVTRGRPLRKALPCGVAHVRVASLSCAPIRRGSQRGRFLGCGACAPPLRMTLRGRRSLPYARTSPPGRPW